MNRKYATRYALGAALVASVGAGGLREVSASEASPKPACSTQSCDFQPERTLLRSSLWAEPCGPELLGKLDPQRFDPNGGPRSPASFVSGVCLFHRVTKQLLPVAAEEGVGFDAEGRAIDELQKAQSAILLPAQRNVAALLEGLAHCRRLDQLRLASAADAAGRVALRDRVCFHRASAKASFGRVDFASFDLAYVDPEEGSVDQLVEAMSTCTASYLGADYGATCGVFSAPGASEVDAVAREVAAEILPNYVGGGDGPHGIPPMSAMLARKVSMASAAMAGSKEAYEQLDKKRVALDRSYRALAAPFGNDARGIPGQVSVLADRYGGAVHEAKVLTDVVDNWMNGLFKDSNNADVRDLLKERTKTASENVSGLSGSAQGKLEENSVLGRLERLKETLASFATGRDAAEKASVTKACRIYYCDIYRGPAQRLTTACRAASATPGRTVGQENALCERDLARQIITNGVTASRICSDAGFDATKACR